jgi:UDP-N-acetylglucosamine 2-epimerase
MIRLLSVVGARPQFVKLAPLVRALDRHHAGRIEHFIVHTGQHYDSGMSDIFFAELELPDAAVNLGVGSGPHGWQTGRMLEQIEEAVLRWCPDLVLTYGDTNSTVAGALVAAKLHVPVAHVEAGVRSLNRCMPEEINRVVADHASDLLLAPTPTAVANLEREGLAQRTLLTGDIMYDAIVVNRDLAVQRSSLIRDLGLINGGYGLVTIHRAENTDDAARLDALLTSLNAIAAEELPLVFPVHPRTRRLIEARGHAWAPHRRLSLLDPIGYLDILALAADARLVLTDSGGLQKEAFFLGCPVVTLRDETEWVETVQCGGNIVTGVDSVAILNAVRTWQARLPTGHGDFSAGVRAAFGDGHAAERIIDAVLALLDRVPPETGRSESLVAPGRRSP